MSGSTDVIESHVPREATVLEVGCGKQPHACTTIGLDRERASARSAGATIPAVTADAERLPFAGNSVDAVLARGVLHHLSNIDAFLAEAKRVLRAGGRLLVLDSGPMPSAEFAHMSRQLTAAGIEPEPRNGVDPEQLQELAGKLGYSQVQTTACGRWTHATPPYTERDYSSPAWLHVLRR